MISDHNLGALIGAPVTGPSNEKIGTVGQVFVDPDTGKPNWVTVQTGLFGRHESFVPVDDATWDREVLHVPFEKDVVKDAPRVDTDQALSAEDEISLYRYYRIPTGDVDPSTFDGNAGRVDDRSIDDERDSAEPPVAAHAAPEPGRAGDERPIGERLADATRRFVEKQKSGSDDRTDTDRSSETRDVADTQDLSETRTADTQDVSETRAADTQDTDEQARGRTRMRRYVIVEEEVPVDSDQGVPGTRGTPRDQQG